MKGNWRVVAARDNIPTHPGHAGKMPSWRKTSINDFQVERKTDEMICPVTIDTGSERTLMRHDVVEHQQLIRNTHRLREVTGHQAEVKGPMDVKLQLSEEEDTFPVYVGDMKDVCILGMDYLISHQCKLDFQLMKLTIGRRNVKLRTANQQGDCL